MGHLPETRLFLFSLWFPAALFCPAGPHSPAAARSTAGFSVLPAPLCKSCCLPGRTENPIGFWLLSDWVNDPAWFSESRLVIVNLSSIYICLQSWSPCFDCLFYFNVLINDPCVFVSQSRALNALCQQTVHVTSDPSHSELSCLEEVRIRNVKPGEGLVSP